MIYGPDDKPIVHPVRKALNESLGRRYSEATLADLRRRFRFLGPTLYDARGNRINRVNAPESS
jgi:hypothetical protein